jgi:site-specific DNA recombinase
MTNATATAEPTVVKRGYAREAPPRENATEVGLHRAVIYLRVSSPSQVHTDYNPEGISLPAQRDACQIKCAALGAEIAHEFVEPGRSATSIENRPVFQEMLAWLKANRNSVDYLVVYHFNRLFRSTIDAAITKQQLTKLGVRIVSTAMDLGDTPESQMVEMILHAVDEYRVKADGADIAYKMGAKAKNGGTIGRARLGYLNARDMSEGRNIGIVEVDPERAPFMVSAFELYATGDFNLETLAEELSLRGLRTRPSGRHPAGPVSTTKLAVLLRDPYYLGYVTYKGELIKGRHEPLISQELFDRVQAVLDGRGGRGERRRRHHHYLKGALWCGHCHDRGDESRMILQWANGRGGRYLYFFCVRKQQHLCDSRYSDGDAVEAAVENWLF